MGERVHVRTNINGDAADFLCEPRQSLLEALRDILGLTGTKEGCNDGNCGACTVIMDGRILDSCCVLAVEAEGKTITTIEGIAPLDGLHPIQQAFLEEAALQCGICTPGFIVAAKALLDREPDADEARIRHWLAGNLCRCTGYDKIVRAVLKAGEMMKQGPAIGQRAGVLGGKAGGTEAGKSVEDVYMA
ncbi:MAG: (2Fe-2S)-binding protein [Dehalococcoidia bacterium]|nr:(2Fe-2S)-binding protein [Dehalococcoidia bacterium]